MSGSLTHSPARIIATMLEDLGEGTLASSGTGDWRIAYAQEPDNPDDMITVYDTTGIIHGRAHTSGEVFQSYGIQVKVRSADHDSGYTKAKSIATAFDETVKYAGVTIGASQYRVYAISKRGSVITLGTEEPTSDRRIFTINALASLRQTV